MQSWVGMSAVCDVIYILTDNIKKKKKKQYHNMGKLSWKTLWPSCHFKGDIQYSMQTLFIDVCQRIMDGSNLSVQSSQGASWWCHRERRHSSYFPPLPNQPEIQQTIPIRQIIPGHVMWRCTIDYATPPELHVPVFLFFFFFWQWLRLRITPLNQAR